MTTENKDITVGGITIPADCRRIFITAELEPSNGDPRIQPTGFPDLGPVLYPDPSGEHGNICIIESEASMANRLEEVCFSNKYEGTLSPTFAGIPYLRAEKKGSFQTASTIDGHRFASDFLAKGTADFGSGNSTLANHIKTSLGMSADGKNMPIARLPEVFELVMKLDTMSLIHGFQISNEQISFVGLRLARALSASITGFGAERVIVPGVKFNYGQVDSASGQPIFQKQRITCKSVQARFNIDVALLASLRLAPPTDAALNIVRLKLLIAISLWKVATFLEQMEIEYSLRSECKLKVKSNSIKYQIDNGENRSFTPDGIIQEGIIKLIAAAQLPAGRSPLVLNFQ